MAKGEGEGVVTAAAFSHQKMSFNQIEPLKYRLYGAWHDGSVAEICFEAIYRRRKREEKEGEGREEKGREREGREREGRKEKGREEGREGRGKGGKGGRKEGEEGSGGRNGGNSAKIII